MKRLDAVIQRTLLGLYFHETGVRLPDTHVPVVCSLEAFQNLSSEQMAALERLTKAGALGKIRILGKAAFTYSILILPDVEHCSLWLFLLYNRVAFIGFTGRREDFS